ncbi:hypothetical protein P7C71_g6544, partial [Lecanoromycetidae sp. Uapishka_2]
MWYALTLMLDVGSRNKLAATNAEMFHRVHGNIGIWNWKKKRFVHQYLQRNKVRYAVLHDDDINQQSEWIVMMKGPSMPDPPPKECHDLIKQTMFMIWKLTSIHRHESIREMTFTEVDMLAPYMFNEYHLADFPRLFRVRIINCRAFTFEQVASSWYETFTDKDVLVDYTYRFRNTRANACYQSATTLANLYQWRESYSGGQSHLFIDNLKTSTKLRTKLEESFNWRSLPRITADELWAFVTGEDQPSFDYKIKKAVAVIAHDHQAHLELMPQAKLNILYECARCGLELPGRKSVGK